MMYRFALTIALGWFGTIFPILVYSIVQNISWVLRLIIPDWIVHGSLIVVLMIWIAIVVNLMNRIWRFKKSKITQGRGLQRFASPRPFPIKPRSTIMPMARTNMPLKLDIPPNEADAQQ